MTTPPKRTDEEDYQLLAEIRAFSEELKRLLGQSASSLADERRGISSLSPKFLLEESLHWVKRFLVEMASHESLMPREVGDRAYALWLFSSYMANYQGLTVVDTDFDALVEFFFWWYPRHSKAASGPFTEFLFDSLNAFFAFLSAEKEDSPSHQAMRDFLPLREKSLQLLELYERLDPESPFFEEQFEVLFGLEPPDSPR